MPDRTVRESTVMKPGDLSHLVATGQPADVADALSRLEPAEAARATASVPREFAPRVLEQPEFERRTSAPFVATLVDVTGLSIYFTVAYIVLRGTLL